MSITFWVVVAVIVIGIGVAIVGGSKKRWYKIHLANNDILLLYKNTADWWIRDTSSRIVFRNEYGRLVGFPSGSHSWILMYEEVKEEEIEVAKAEIARTKRSDAESE